MEKTIHLIHQETEQTKKFVKKVTDRVIDMADKFIDIFDEGRKTQTRRIVSTKDIGVGVTLMPLYHAGEVVAIAQKYRECNRNVCLADKAGWNNKMFVLADLMPNRIRITSRRVERLQ